MEQSSSQTSMFLRQYDLNILLLLNFNTFTLKDFDYLASFGSKLQITDKKYKYILKDENRFFPTHLNIAAIQKRDLNLLEKMKLNEPLLTSNSETSKKSQNKNKATIRSDHTSCIYTNINAKVNECFQHTNCK